MRCRTYLGSRRILTPFPFPAVLLGSRLGPTNPWLIGIAKEPLPFRRCRFSRHYDPTTARILIPARSTLSCEKASALAGRPPTTQPKLICSIGGQLNPVHFRGPRPRRVSCYALFKGWLLLSQPPRCLRPRTPFTL